MGISTDSIPTVTFFVLMDVFTGKTHSGWPPGSTQEICVAELFVNIISSIKGNTDIAIGNVLGSNIANVFLILGVSSIIYPLTVGTGTVWKEIPLSLLAALLLGILANDQLIDKASFSSITRIDGLVFLSFFIP